VTILERKVVAEIADALWRAEVDRAPIAPITEGRPYLTVEDAYAIQTVNIERRVVAGALIRGRKVGLTSEPMQRLLGVNEPDFGALLDDMFVEDGDEIALGTMLQPRVEAEMAFVMARDLAGPGVTVAHALAAVGGVLPAIEIVDSRIADWRITLVDTVADNASCGRLVLGGTLTPVTDVDLRLIGMLLSRNGVPIDSGAGAAALGNPARCVAWLANKLAELGSGLRRDDIVLPGALHRMTPALPGDVFRAEFAHLGSVTVRFGEEAAA
jgi:2-keto-4-pentenoate hydratase